MRSLLFLLIGLALACLIGFAMFDAPASRIEEVPTDATSGESSVLLLGLLVFGSWATLLVRGPPALQFVLACLVIAAGLIAVLAGAFAAYWDHYMRPGETIGWWAIGAGVLMLSSQVVAALRPARGERR